MFTHDSLWKAIDLLAEKNGLSPSGLAKKAKLSPTLFNPSKRASKARKRWPSTESIAAILKATGTTLEAFVALIEPEARQNRTLALLSLVEAASNESFDAQTGTLLTEKLDTMPLPADADKAAFAIELSGKSFEPAYHDGDKIVLSPAEKLRRGDHVCVRTKQGEIHIRLLGLEGAQKIELLAFTPNTAPLTLAKKDILWMHRIVWASK